MKYLRLTVIFISLSAWLVGVACGQDKFRALCDSAMKQTDIELFGTDKPTNADIERAIAKAGLDKDGGCDCNWIVERLEKYIVQLDSGQITVRDMKSYLLDIKILIKMQKLANKIAREDKTSN